MKPYYQHNNIIIYHADCKDVLPELEPVDLVLTDPPYGIGADKAMYKVRNTKPGKALAFKRNYGNTNWDTTSVDFSLLWDLLSLGKYACCFGGNYYPFPPSACWLIWDKINGDNKFADCELIWTNFPGAVRMIKHLWNGMLREGKEYRQHPTQKPKGVIRWCIKQADKHTKITTILDPFMGSGTTLLAAKQLNRHAIGIEISEKYCEIAARRLSQEYLPFNL